jgi:hypothetical protein
MNALSPHHPFPPRPESSPAACISRSFGATDAVNVPDVASTLTVNWPVALVPPFGTIIVKGELLHATPGDIVAGQLTVTGPENPPLAVTVTVELWLVPVDEFNVTALSDTAIPGKIGAVTVKFTEFEYPPGYGSATWMGNTPPLVRKFGKMDAVNCAALTNVVCVLVPLKTTSAPC